MKRFASLIVAIAVFAVFADGAFAQREEGRRGPEGRDARRRGVDRERRGPRDGRPPVPPIIAALDADKDGVISSEEIENAVAALKTLDKNGDGELSGDEIHPPRRGLRGPGGPPGRGPAAFIERIMENDENDDGKLSKDEVPERMLDRFDRIDTNSDGFIDESELQEMMDRFRERGGRRGRGDSDERPRRRQRPDRESDEQDDDPDA